MSNGGPSVASRNGSSSFMNGKGNASAFGNNIAQTNGNGATVSEELDLKAHDSGKGPAVENGHSAANGNGITNLNGKALGLPDEAGLGRAEELDDVSLLGAQIVEFRR